MMISIYDQTVLDGATSRGVLQARKMLVSPQYQEFLKENEGSAKDLLDFEDVSGITHPDLYKDIQPYRYFFYSSDALKKDTEKIVEDIIKKNTVFNPSGQVNVSANVEKYVIYNTIEVTAEKEVLPEVKIMGLHLPALKVSSRAKAVVNDPVDFIRNVDLANEILTEFEITGEGGKISEMMDSLKNMVGRFF